MSLELKDITSRDFKKLRFGGYRPEDVEELLEKIRENFKTLIDQNNKLTTENNHLFKENESFKTKITRHENLISDTLLNAQKSANLRIMEAEQKANSIIEKANIKSKSLISEASNNLQEQKQSLEEIKIQTAKFRSNLLEIYKEHIKIIGAIPAENYIPLEKEQKQKSSVSNDLSETHDKKEDSSIETIRLKNPQKTATASSGGNKYKIKSLNKFSDLKFGDAYEELN
ncbi:MAG: DivIVA domain-containing protein [Oscillospiraceae bacterium]|jgi:cell division initiation protein|nr:DivIVA domain-containing protein [Oscillospiraceae bacterium]